MTGSPGRLPRGAIFGCLTLVLLGTIFLALGVGAGKVGWSDLTRVALGEADSWTRAILIDVRLPRILLAALVGAALSAAGASFQAALRNPLADPYILGVSGGAALGAVAFTALVDPMRRGPPSAGRRAAGAMLTIVVLSGWRALGVDGDDRPVARGRDPNASTPP